LKILLVEDDRRIAEPLKEDLEHQHYRVDLATDGDLGWAFALNSCYDLILLDVMLPKRSGLVLCRDLRNQGCNTPILMLTARDTTGDKVLGLDAGADDYLVKPFELEELGARIRALLRRNNGDRKATLGFGALLLDPASCVVTFAGQRVSFTPTEYALLELFLRHPRQTFSREALIDRLWTLDEPPGDDVIKAHIKGLRRKLREAGCAEEIVETVYGFGYRLRANVP